MLRFTLYSLMFFLLVSVLSVAGVAWYVMPQLPDIDTLRDVQLQVPLRVYSAEGSLISEFGEQKRIPVNIESVPEPMIHAILAAEDDRFYQHPGVDWQGILRAVIQLVKTGEKTQGGSTITMQVARNFFLTREKTYLRKLNEIFLALKIERELTKNQILELYLNKIYLGQRAYGVAAAAQVYYGLDLDQLTIPQYAMLAGLPKAPSTTNPISNPDRAKKRRDYVLLRMFEEGYINKSEYDTAIHTEDNAHLYAPDIELEAPYVAEMVRQKLVDEFGDAAYSSGFRVFTTIHDKNQNAANAALRKGLQDYDERHGYRGAEHHFDLTPDMNETQWKQLLESFTVYGDLYPALVIAVHEKSINVFTLDDGVIELPWDAVKWARKFISENYLGAVPKNAEEIASVGDIVRVYKNEDDHWKFSQIPEIEGALVSLDPNNGAILALTGGFDFLHSKFNRVTQALRQPGSGFKPFIYSAALEAGFTAASMINDAPVVFEDPGLEDVWRPENYSRKTYGPTRLRVALTHSRNLVSIRLLHSIGVPFALDHVAKFGFDIDKLPKNLSIALGSGAITPLQQARGYAVFANGGYLINPYFIDRIETETGNTIYKSNPAIVCRGCNSQTIYQPQNGADNNLESTSNNAENVKPVYAPLVVDPENIWIMDSITRDVIQFGTGQRAKVLNRKDLSGKTGTTNDQRDAWFSGFNTNIVAIAWVGFDKFLPLGRAETGARAALPIWIDYMKVALEGMPESILEKPPGLVFAKINPDTGQLAAPDSPNAIFEVFTAKTAPQSDTNYPAAGTGSGNSSNIIQDIF